MDNGLITPIHNFEAETSEFYGVENKLKEKIRNENDFVFDPWEFHSLRSDIGEGFDEIILNSGSRAEWKIAGQVHKAFSTSTCIRQVLWTHMEGSTEPSLCFLHHDSVTVSSPSGYTMDVRLPFAVDRIFPLQVGILLQESEQAHSDSNTRQGQNETVPLFHSPHIGRFGGLSSTSRSQRGRRSAQNVDSGFFESNIASSRQFLFAVTHPEEELKEVVLKDKSGHRQSHSEIFIFSDPQSGVLVSHSKDLKKHTLWKVSNSDSSTDLSRTEAILESGAEVESAHDGPADRVFFFQDANQPPLLVLFFRSAQVVQLFSLTPSLDVSVGPTTCMPALDVAALCSWKATHPWKGAQFPTKFLVVLSREGHLSVLRGSQPLWTAHSLPAGVSGLGSWPHLIHAAGDRLSIGESSGKAARFRFKLQPRCPLLLPLFESLSHGFKAQSSFRAFLSAVMGASSAALEWHVFFQAAQATLSQEQRPNRPQSAFQELLGSRTHEKFYSLGMYRDRLRLPAPSPSGDSGDSAGDFFASLSECDWFQFLEDCHLIHEDLRLDTTQWRDLEKLATLILLISQRLNETEFVDMYLRTYPHLASTLSPTFLAGPSSGSSPVPRDPVHMPALLLSLVWSEDDPSEAELAVKQQLASRRWLKWANHVLDLFLLLRKHKRNSQDVSFLSLMVSEQFGLSEIDRLDPGVALPLRQALASCHDAPPSAPLSPEFCALIGRNDLNSTSLPALPAQSASSLCAPHSMPLTQYSDPGGTMPLSAVHFGRRDRAETAPLADSSGNSDRDGMGEMLAGKWPWLRFSQDSRLAEARRFLSSSKPVSVSPEPNEEAADPEFASSHQRQLAQIAQRTASLPVGRAAFTFASLTQPITEPLPVPSMVYSGRLPAQQNATVSLDLTAEGLKELTEWPEFHNGVAAGLRLAPSTAGVIPEWIGYNRPAEPSFSHAGFLLALGLTGHLAVLPAPDLYRYLSQENDPTTIAVLLGVAAARRGSMDPSTSKMLYLHIPTKHPPSFPDLDLASAVQSSALVAVGLLYQGTAHRLTTEILLSEIDRRPNPNSSSPDREAYSFAAGIALGLVTLGQGSHAWGLSDLHLESRLQRLFSSSSESEGLKSSREDVTAVTTQLDVGQPNSSQILEGAMVNLDVTSPGAIIALCLMYLKSNDAAVASLFHIPQSLFSLELVRPDFLLLRVLARNLVLWDSVTASSEWLDSQLPAVIRQSSWRIAQGAQRSPSDLQTIHQSHASILTGACMALGLRYAGTGNEAARALLHSYVILFLKEKRFAKMGVVTGKGMFGGHVDPVTLEGYMGSIVLALALVMAGSGDLSTLRLLRFLRRRSTSDGTLLYGHFLALSQSLGFLFLGGGAVGFGRTQACIAALLISVLPKFPVAAGDNKCHLQPLRHLWVLASERRALSTVDADSLAPVSVPVLLHLLPEETGWRAEQAGLLTVKDVTPCLLPEYSLVKSISLQGGSQFWTKTIEFADGRGAASLLSTGTIFLKRKPASQAQKDSVLPLPASEPAVAGSDLTDPALRELLAMLQRHDPGNFSPLLSALPFFGSTAHSAMVPTFLFLLPLVEPLLSTSASLSDSLPLALHSIKTICDRGGRAVGQSRSSLLPSAWLIFLSLSIDKSLSTRNVCGKPVTARQLAALYVKSVVSSPKSSHAFLEVTNGDAEVARWLACGLQWYELPCWRLIRCIGVKFKEVSAQATNVSLAALAVALVPNVSMSAVRVMEEGLLPSESLDEA